MRTKVFLLTLVFMLLYPLSAYCATDAVPVLMYHSIDNIKGNPAIVTPMNFKKQMQYLKDEGYTTITLDQLYAFLTKKNYKLPNKAIVITFDDGYRDTYTTALPILKKYNFKATLFAITSKLDKGLFTPSQLAELQQSSIGIYSHTHTHPSLKKLSAPNQEKEIIDADKKITKLNNKKTYYFCYPYGHFNKSTINILKKHKYKLGFTSQPGWAKKGDNLLTLKRIYVGNTLSFSSFKERVNNPNYKLY